jgi:hypothetical protein
MTLSIMTFHRTKLSIIKLTLACFGLFSLAPMKWQLQKIHKNWAESGAMTDSIFDIQDNDTQHFDTLDNGNLHLTLLSIMTLSIMTLSMWTLGVKLLGLITISIWDSG